MKKNLLRVGFAGAALIVSSTIVMAAPAVATANVNVRSGPSGHYSAVDTLRRGQRVDVQVCRGSWCLIEKRGPDGWVSSNYLRAGRGNDGGYTVRPGTGFDPNFGYVPAQPAQPALPLPPREPPRPRPGQPGVDAGYNGGHHGNDGYNSPDNGGWENDDSGWYGPHR